MKSLRKTLDLALGLAFPQSCHVCAEEVESFELGIACRKCWIETQLFDQQIISCYKCCAFLGKGKSDVQVFCHLCDAEFFDLVRCVGFYEKALMKTVLHLKHTPWVPSYLRDLICKAYLNSPFDDADVIIPVPISKARLAERGFNQAKLLAKPLQKFGLRIDETSLVRKLHTPRHRPGMDKKARQMAVENAFAVAKPDEIKDKCILLVDDVFTSGATVSNCAKALKESGARKVYVFAVARASALS